ncbi:MAG: hypothetical protein ACIAXF_10125 [Phycisphaerales bacterium JB063]
MKPLFHLTLLLAVGFLLPACGDKKPTDAEIADAVAAFVEQYESAYQSNDRESVLVQVDWPAVDEELREFTKAYVFPFQGQVALLSAESQPYEPAPDDPAEYEGHAIVPSPTPTHRVTLIFEPPNPYAEPEPIDILVVWREDKVRLCGWARAQ